MSIPVRMSFSNHIEKSKAFDEYHAEADRIRGLINTAVNKLNVLTLGDVRLLNLDVMRSLIKEQMEFFKDDIVCQKWSNVPIEGLIAGREVYLLEILCVVDERLISEKVYDELISSVKKILNEFVSAL